jgi:hypothetical protein
MSKSDKPVSLYPLEPDEALEALLWTKPPRVGQLVFASGHNGVFRIMKVRSGTVDLELVDVKGEKVWHGEELDTIPLGAIAPAPIADTKKTKSKK